MLGLSDNLTQTVFVYLYIFTCVFGCQALGIIGFEVLVPMFPSENQENLENKENLEN